MICSSLNRLFFIRRSFWVFAPKQQLSRFTWSVLLGADQLLYQLPSLASEKSSLAQPSMKLRKAFVMSIHPRSEQEYKSRHNPIWPDLEKALKEHGVSNYSIFLHPEIHQLFGYAEMENKELWCRISTTAICRKRRRHMRRLCRQIPILAPQTLPGGNVSSRPKTKGRSKVRKPSRFS